MYICVKHFHLSSECPNAPLHRGERGHMPTTYMNCKRAVIFSIHKEHLDNSQGQRMNALIEISSQQEVITRLGILSL